jgi:hypothetical protein
VRCGVAQELGPADNVRTDWSGETRVWLAEAEDDTLRLTRKGQCGDECSYEEEILLAPLGAACPTFVRARTTRIESGSPLRRMEQVREATKGSVEIQDWHPTGGVVSGRVRAEFEFTFYVEMPHAPGE